MSKQTAKNITAVLVDRANYGRIKPVLIEMQNDPEINLSIICTGTMVLERFGKATDVVRNDGLEITEEIYVELEGSNLNTMAKTIGLAIIELSSALSKLNPDFVLLIGDRYEALSAAIASVYQNFCLIHLQGGEITGSIDESARHAITKLAHYHFPATKQSGRYITKMGESSKHIFPLGCPSADVIDRAKKEVNKMCLDQLGVGPSIDIEKPYILSLFHPVTSEYLNAEQQMGELLEALTLSEKQVILIWPNIDAGSDGISQAVRRFRENHPAFLLHVYKNFEPEDYIPLLKNAVCAVGNSSSFVRDASFLGTPVVLVGSRQDGREWGKAVMRVEPIKSDILRAIKEQIRHGSYPPDTIYGTPGVSRKIVQQIKLLRPHSQKRLNYSD